MSGLRESVEVRTATIANGATVSDAVDLGVGVLVGIEMPGTMTGTAITFQVSNDGSAFQALHDRSTNTAISLTFTVSKSYSIEPTLFAGYRYIKVVSGSAEGASRAIKLSSRVVA